MCGYGTDASRRTLVPRLRSKRSVHQAVAGRILARRVGAAIGFVASAPKVGPKGVPTSSRGVLRVAGYWYSCCRCARLGGEGHICFMSVGI